MSTENLMPALAGLLRRQWWLIVISLVVAAIVGFVASSGQQTLYVGSATIVVDPATVSKGVGIPEAELLLKSIQSDAFREKVATNVGATAAELKADAKVYTTGTPQDRLVAEFTSPAEGRADAVAAALAGTIVAEAKSMGAVEIEKQRQIVQETSNAVAQLEAFKGTNAWEQSDVAYKLWTLKKDLASAKATLALDENAYAYDGSSSVKVSGAADQRRLATTGAAAFLGLIAGLGLAILREWRGVRAAGA